MNIKVLINGFRHPDDAQKWINHIARNNNIKSVDIIPLFCGKEHGYTVAWVKIEIHCKK